METLFFTLAAASAFIGVVSSLMMVSYCNEKGIKINWFLIRIFIFKYVSLYKELTSKENGKPGFWYYLFIISFNSLLFFTIILMLIKHG